jgi:hypothetical protein
VFIIHDSSIQLLCILFHPVLQKQWSVIHLPASFICLSMCTSNSLIILTLSNPNHPYIHPSIHHPSTHPFIHAKCIDWRRKGKQWRNKLNIVPAQRELSWEKHSHILSGLSVERVEKGHIHYNQQGLLLRKGDIWELMDGHNGLYHSEAHQSSGQTPKEKKIQVSGNYCFIGKVWVWTQELPEPPAPLSGLWTVEGNSGPRAGL